MKIKNGDNMQTFTQYLSDDTDQKIHQAAWMIAQLGLEPISYLESRAKSFPEIELVILDYIGEGAVAPAQAQPQQGMVGKMVGGVMDKLMGWYYKEGPKMYKAAIDALTRVKQIADKEPDKFKVQSGRMRNQPLNKYLDLVIKELTPLMQQQPQQPAPATTPTTAPTTTAAPASTTPTTAT